jgi:hypothetical protein
MNTRLLKIAAAGVVLFFIGAGVGFADGWKGRGHYGPPGRAHGYTPHKGPPPKAPVLRHAYQKQRHYHHHYHAYRPRYPVVVHKHYYQPPAYYVAPAPRGYFFGMSAFEPGFGFTFGISGR